MSFGTVAWAPLQKTRPNPPWERNDRCFGGGVNGALCIFCKAPFLGGTDERTTWLRVEHLETVTHPVYQLVTVEEEACNLTIIIH